MKFILDLSLRFKLMVLMATLTSMVLAVYAFIALQDYQRDKLATVFSANTSQAETTAVQIAKELSHHTVLLNEVVKRRLNSLAPEDDSIFSYKHLWVYRWSPADRDFVPILNIVSSKGSLKKDNSNKNLTDDLRKARQQAMELDVTLLPGSIENQWFVAAKFTLKGSARPYLAVAELDGNSLFSQFHKMTPQNLYLTNYHNNVILSSINPIHDLDPQHRFELVQKSSEHFQNFTTLSEIGNDVMGIWFVSSAPTSVGGLRVLAVTPKNSAMRGIHLLMVKSALLFVFLSSITVIVSVISSGSITFALRKLLAGTIRVSQGDLDFQIDIKAKDEIGHLAEGFNQMTGEIRRLLTATAENARMEGELKTAQLVQATLFPEPTCSGTSFEIKGYYKPASECSGDWWGYNEIGNYIYLWIGDATGHGVPAALVTSAVKSAISIFEHIEELPLEETLEHINRAVYGTARGKVNMTFFGARLNKNTGEFVFSNASHDIPFILPILGDGERLEKSHLQPLMGDMGLRLGENPDSTYTTKSIQLNPGDRIIFYTDGVTELHNNKGEMWGERKFVHTLLLGCNEKTTIEHPMKLLGSAMDEFQKDAQLQDDVTYFMLQYTGGKVAA